MMRKEQKKGKRRVDCGIFKMVDSCCCFITVNPWATSCSNPNMTTDPYGKPFRTVLGYLCEAKRLTAIFKCSRTLSSYLPCGLLPSQIIFVCDHLNKWLLSKRKKKKELLRCTKKENWFSDCYILTLLHSACLFFRFFPFYQNECVCVIPSTHTAVSLFSSGSSSSSVCVITDHEVETELLLHAKLPINPSERGRHESWLKRQSRPHCSGTSIKHPKLLMCVPYRDWT